MLSNPQPLRFLPYVHHIHLTFRSTNLTLRSSYGTDCSAQRVLIMTDSSRYLDDVPSRAAARKCACAGSHSLRANHFTLQRAGICKRQQMIKHSVKYLGRQHSTAQHRACLQTTMADGPRLDGAHRTPTGHTDFGMQQQQLRDTLACTNDATQRHDGGVSLQPDVSTRDSIAAGSRALPTSQPQDPAKSDSATSDDQVPLDSLRSLSLAGSVQPGQGQGQVMQSRSVQQSQWARVPSTRASHPLHHAPVSHHSTPPLNNFQPYAQQSQQPYYESYNPMNQQYNTPYSQAYPQSHHQQACQQVEHQSYPYRAVPFKHTANQYQGPQFFQSPSPQYSTQALPPRNPAAAVADQAAQTQQIPGPPKSFKSKVQPPVRPRPTKTYLKLARQPPKRLPGGKSQPLLIIFDLNGTLLARHLNKDMTAFTPRPNLDTFISWIFDDDNQYHHQHRAMVWSSAQPKNVNGMVDKLFTTVQREKLVAVWARDKLNLTSQQYHKKVQVYKELRKVWADQTISKTHPSGPECRWNQSNTILVDDSIIKASGEPFNLLQISEFVKAAMQDDALERARDYIEEASRWQDVSAYMRSRPFSTNGVDGVKLPGAGGNRESDPASQEGGRHPRALPLGRGPPKSATD